jgi:UDP-N-acetylmuramoylalanine-D-glutamate ligase
MNTVIAVLGCGYWGRNLIRNCHELGALAFVCDPAKAVRIAARQVAPGVEVADWFGETRPWQRGHRFRSNCRARA